MQLGVQFKSIKSLKAIEGLKSKIFHDQGPTCKT
jgi:hypothetical protein